MLSQEKFMVVSVRVEIYMGARTRSGFTKGEGLTGIQSHQIRVTRQDEDSDTCTSFSQVARTVLHNRHERMTRALLVVKLTHLS